MQQNSRKRYLLINTVLFAINSIGTRIITFLLVPLYTNVFSTAEYGVIDLITTIGIILVPIITVNIGEAVMRFSLDEDADKTTIASVGVFFSAISFLLGSIVVFTWNFFPQIGINKWVVYLYCVSQGLYITFSCNLRGQEKLAQFAIGNIIHTFAVATLNIVLLIYVKLGVNGYFGAYIISNIVTVLYCIVVGDVIEVLKRFRLRRELMKSMIAYSIVLVPNSLMWWIMNSSDHIMVTSMIGAAANGIYAVSYKIPSILSSLSTVFNQAWSYSAIKENKSEDKEAFNNNMFDMLVSFQLIVTVFLMFIIKPFLKIYVQESYYEAWKYTPYLLTGYFFLTMGTFLSTQYTVNKDSKGFLLSGTIGAIINIVLNALLIPKFKIHGAAFATCISYISVFLYRVIDTKKYIKINVFWGKYVIGYVILIITAITMFVPGRAGISLLLVELLSILILYRKFLIIISTSISGLVKYKIKR